uniref:Uncharacterized protein n=1 Tax=Romanomermis culicivorax TaxID=13658 RepID=A0A915JLR0_ROMCU
MPFQTKAASAGSNIFEPAPSCPDAVRDRSFHMLERQPLAGAYSNYVTVQLNDSRHELAYTASLEKCSQSSTCRTC